MAKIVKIHSPLCNERGLALIVSMLLLAVMSILGTLLLNNSTTEIQLSSNYRDTREAHYVAATAIEYAINYQTSGTTSVDLLGGGVPAGLFTSDDGLGDLKVGSVFTQGVDETNGVAYLGITDAKAGSGESSKVSNYIISVVGTYPAAQANPSSGHLVMHVQRSVSGDAGRTDL